MSNYKTGESADLFDFVTGEYVGVMDAQGRENLVPTLKTNLVTGGAVMLKSAEAGNVHLRRGLTSDLLDIPDWTISESAPRMGHFAPAFRALTALIPNFGSSTPDNALRGGISTASTLFYDPVNGLDANNGTSALTPKRTLPFYPSGNCKHMVAAGSTIRLGNQAGNYFAASGTNIVISVYDANPVSATFGQEITWQPNPFLRALAGKWITAEEKQRYYFTIDAESPPDSLVATRCVGPDNGGLPFCIRGAVLKNATRGGVVVKNALVRLEDCVIEDILQNPSASNAYYGGVGIRCENANGQVDGARLWISNIGEDVAWIYTGTGHKFSDCAILHTCEKQVYGVQHCDVFQMSSYPGAFVFRRLVIFHKVKNSVLLDSGNTETTPVGAVWMSTGSAGTDTPGGLIEDVVYLTNRQGDYFQHQSGIVKRRVIGVLDGRISVAQSNLSTISTPNHAEESCVWARVGTPSAIRALVGGNDSKRPSSIDIDFSE